MDKNNVAKQKYVFILDFRVHFGEIKNSFPDIDKLRVTHIEHDCQNNNRVICSQKYHIFTIDTFSKSVFTLYVSTAENNNMFITSFMQMPQYPNDLIIVDKGTNMIVKINASTSKTVVRAAGDGNRKTVDGTSVFSSFN